MTIDEAAEFIQEWRNTLCLEHWKINLTPAETNHDDERFADVTRDFRNREAEITLYPEFFDQTEAFQKKTLLHELIHVSLAGMRAMMLRLSQGENIPGSIITLTEEHAVVRFADTFEALGHLADENTDGPESSSLSDTV